MNWTEIVIELNTAGVEAMANQLHELNAGGVVIEHCTGQASKLTAYFPPGDPANHALDRLKQLGGDLVRWGLAAELPRITASSLAEADWESQWKEHYHPVAIGPVIIIPSWLAADGAGPLTVRLDPGMAFGTGIHPTTQLCVRELCLLVEEGDQVADLGCGSGILSIVAALLGAGAVRAVDSDSTAVRVARENVASNGCQGKVEVAMADALRFAIGPETRVAVANIGLEAASTLLGRYVRGDLDAGYLLLSGFPRGELPGLVEQAGPLFVRSRCKGDWGLLLAGRKQ